MHGLDTDSFNMHNVIVTAQNHIRHIKLLICLNAGIKKWFDVALNICI